MFLKSFMIVTFSFLVLGFSSVFAKNIILKNDIWTIEINPANLETKAILPSSPSITVSSSSKTFKASEEKALDNQATWTIDKNIKFKEE